MLKELDLVEKKDMREELIDNVEVLDKVKELHTLPGTEYMTTRQVAEFYEVTREVINRVNIRHREELSEDGALNMKAKDIENKLRVDKMSKRYIPGGIEVDGVYLSYSANMLFTKRAVLRIGMLLRDSEVAKEVRTLLLNVYHDVQEGKEDIKENITKEYEEQMKLYMEYGKAISEGNMEEVVKISTAINEIKNRRIKETEDKLAKSEQEKIEMARYSTTIQESRQIIRRIVNTISYSHYNGDYVSTWNELHRKANYMLGINIKKRVGHGSLLSKYTDVEIKELEIIAKNWAVKLGHNLEDILQLN